MLICPVLLVWPPWPLHYLLVVDRDAQVGHVVSHRIEAQHACIRPEHQSVSGPEVGLLHYHARREERRQRQAQTLVLHRHAHSSTLLPESAIHRLPVPAVVVSGAPRHDRPLLFSRPTLNVSAMSSQMRRKLLTHLLILLHALVMGRLPQKKRGPAIAGPLKASAGAVPV